MYQLLKGKHERLGGELLDFTRALIATPSGSMRESAVADLVHAEMLKLHFDRVERDEAGNVVGVILGRQGEPTVLLNSHLDTVRPNVSEWTRDPYDSTVEEGWIHGVGAADCKGGLSAQVYAAELLRRSLLPLRGNLVVAATVSEECGGSLGVAHLMEHTLPALALHPDSVILGEPTGKGLYYGHDGWMEMNVSIHGPSHDEVNHVAMDIYRDLGRSSRAGQGRMAEGEALAVGYPLFITGGGDNSRRADIHVAKRLSGHESPTLVLESIQHEVDLVSGTVSASAPAVSVAVQVIEEEKKFYTGQRAVVTHLRGAWQTDPYDPLIERARQALTAAGCKVRLGRWQLGRLGMGTAGHLFRDVHGIPTLGYGPGSEDFAHAVDERVAVADVLDVAYGTACIVHGLIGVPVCGWTSDEI
jgi:acetylornithine deacetylase/succinyl-diaminopimelate desuccinylase-like protein